MRWTIEVSRNDTKELVHFWSRWHRILVGPNAVRYVHVCRHRNSFDEAEFGCYNSRAMTTRAMADVRDGFFRFNGFQG